MHVYILHIMYTIYHMLDTSKYVLSDAAEGVVVRLASQTLDMK